MVDALALGVSSERSGSSSLPWGMIWHRGQTGKVGRLRGGDTLAGSRPVDARIINWVVIP